MPTYTFSAAKKDGALVSGERDVENEKQLAQALRAEGLLMLRAKEKGTDSKSIAKMSVDVGDLIARIRRISLVEKMLFSRNLAVMISAGLPLTRALDASAEEIANPKFKTIIQDISSSVVKGKTFAESLSPHNRVFNELYVNMIEVGETTGKLSLVLKLLANQMKKDHDIRSRVKGAMMYPAIIIMALGIIGALMMVYVVPTLTATIKELKVDIPVTTQIIMKTSEILATHYLLVVAGVIAVAGAGWKFLKSPVGKRMFDTLILKVPVFGPLVQKFNMARFSRTLSYLVTSGIPIVKSLEITARVLGNTHYRQAVVSASEDIQKGKQLNEILHGYPRLFFPMVIQMIKVGEESGKISDMLLRLALFFEEDVTNTTKNLSTIIEPMLMIVIGAVVGFFAISMLQPIYSSLGNL